MKTQKKKHKVKKWQSRNVKECRICFKKCRKYFQCEECRSIFCEECREYSKVTWCI